MKPRTLQKVCGGWWLVVGGGWLRVILVLSFKPSLTIVLIQILLLFSNLLYFTPVSSTSDKYMFIFAVEVNDMFCFLINLEMISEKTYM